MNLYQINEAIENAFMNCIDPETGEIVGDTSVLDDLQIQRDEKIENIALYIKNLKAEAEAIQNEERKLKSRRQTCENRADWLKKYLANNLQGEKFKTARVAVSWRKSQSVEVEDVWQLPDEFVRMADPEPNKTAIKEALKAGLEVPGAELVDNLSMTIR